MYESETLWVMFACLTCWQYYVSRHVRGVIVHYAYANMMNRICSLGLFHRGRYERNAQPNIAYLIIIEINYTLLTVT